MAENGWARTGWVGALVGIFSGGLTVLLVESLGHQLLGTADPSAPETISTAMFASVLVAWVTGCGVAAFVAMRWSRSSPIWPGVVPALMLVGGTVANFLAFPHPVWMMVVAPPVMLAAAWVVARANRREVA